MIDFSNLPRTPKKHLFYVPKGLKCDVLHFLKKAGIPCESITHEQIMQKHFGRLDVNDGATSEQMNAMKRFYEAGYPDVFYMDGIVTNVDPNQLFQACCQLFSDTIDADWKTYMTQHDANMIQIAQTYITEKDHGRRPSYQTSFHKKNKTEIVEEIIPNALRCISPSYLEEIKTLPDGHFYIASACLPQEDFGYIGLQYKRNPVTKKVTKYKTEEICIIMQVDKSNEKGYRILTAFPLMENPWIVESNTDTKQEIRETERFKKGDAALRAHMLYFMDHDPERIATTTQPIPGTNKHSIEILLLAKEKNYQMHVVSLTETEQVLYSVNKTEKENACVVTNDFLQPEIKETFYKNYPDAKEVIEELIRLFSIEMLHDVTTSMTQTDEPNTNTTNDDTTDNPFPFTM